MQNNLNQKEQLMWALTETGRMIIRALQWPARAWEAYGVEVRRRQFLEAKLAGLTNHGLIDRLLEAQDFEIAEEAITELLADFEEPRQSIDGIMGTAA